jgi:hypothetical protein
MEQRRAQWAWRADLLIQGPEKRATEKEPTALHSEAPFAQTTAVPTAASPTCTPTAVRALAAAAAALANAPRDRKAVNLLRTDPENEATRG